MRAFRGRGEDSASQQTTNGGFGRSLSFRTTTTNGQDVGQESSVGFAIASVPQQVFAPVTTTGGFGRSTSFHGQQQSRQVQEMPHSSPRQTPSQPPSSAFPLTRAPQPKFAPVTTTAGGFGRSTSFHGQQQKSQEVLHSSPRQTPSQPPSSAFAPVTTTPGGFGRSTSFHGQQQQSQQVQEMPHWSPQQTPSQPPSSAFPSTSAPQHVFAPVTTSGGFGRSTSFHGQQQSQQAQEMPHWSHHQTPSQPPSSGFLPTSSPQQEEESQHHSVVRRIFPSVTQPAHRPTIVQRSVSFAPEMSQGLHESVDRANDEIYAEESRDREVGKLDTEVERQLLSAASALDDIADQLRVLVAQSRNGEGR